MHTIKHIEKMHIGWREWVSLPQLSIPAIKAKIDTGAATSSIHAFNIKTDKTDKNYIEFEIHPLQKNNRISINCRARLVDIRRVKSSNGQAELRYVIRTPISIGANTWEIDITLTNRDLMTYRMLIGRRAMENVYIEPTHSFVQGRLLTREIKNIYQLK